MGDKNISSNNKNNNSSNNNNNGTFRLWETNRQHVMKTSRTVV